VTTGVEVAEVAAAVDGEIATTTVVAVAEVTVKAPFGTPVALLTITVEPTGAAQLVDAKVGMLAVLDEIAVNVIVIAPVAAVAMPVADTVKVTGPVA
jgi:hypothetical protein